MRQMQHRSQSRATLRLMIISFIGIFLVAYQPKIAQAQWSCQNSVCTTLGNVGIGTTGPSRNLDLIGDVGGLSFEAGSGSPNSGIIRFGDNTGWKLHFGRSRESTNGAFNSGTAGVLMTIQDNGNVGIGTTTPAYKLQIGNYDSDNNVIQMARPALSSSLDIYTPYDGSGSAYVGYGVQPLSKKWGVWASNLASGPSSGWLLTVDPITSNVGIGTTNPQSKLVVATPNNSVSMAGTRPLVVSGAQGATLGLVGNNTRGVSLISDWPTVGLNIYYNGGWKSISNGWSGTIYASQDDGHIGIATAPNAGGADTSLTTTERLTITNSGNVGIGTVSPTVKLDVNGAAAIANNQNLSFKSATNALDAGIYEGPGGSLNIKGPSAGNILFRDNADTITNLSITSAGYVGVGVSYPDKKFHVKGTNYSMSVLEDDTNPYLVLRHGGAAAGVKNIALQQANGDLAISTMNDTYGWTGNLVVIKNNGNVGIGTGTAAPNAKLQVVGDVNVSGNIAAKYQDVAEWVTSPKAMSAGTVVVLDTAHSNQVLPSVQAYDTRVAGVVSDTPGLILGEGGDGKVKVATTGRVKVKVDATKEPVQVGDLLVTSDKEGVAMKSEPMQINGRPFHQPGTILGKALEPLKEGEGEILVLLSMQ